MPSNADRQTGDVMRRVSCKGGKERPKMDTHIQDAQYRFQEGGCLAGEGRGVSDERKNRGSNEMDVRWSQGSIYTVVFQG